MKSLEQLNLKENEKKALLELKKNCLKDFRMQKLSFMAQRHGGIPMLFPLFFSSG